MLRHLRALPVVGFIGCSSNSGDVPHVVGGSAHIPGAPTGEALTVYAQTLEGATIGSVSADADEIGRASCRERV